MIFEMKKILKTPLVWLFFLLSFVVLFLPFLFSQFNQYEFSITMMLDSQLNQVGFELMGDPENEFNLAQRHYLEEMLSGINLEDNERVLRAELSHLAFLQTQDPALVMTGVREFDFDKDQAVLSSLLERGLPYVLPRTPVRDLPLMQYWQEFFLENTSLYLIMLALFIVTIITNEKRGTSQDLAGITPISLMNVLAKRMLATLSVVLSLFIVPFVLVSLVITFLNGFGSWSYPIYINAQLHDIGSLLLQNIGMLILWLIVYSLAGFLLNYLTGSFPITLGIVLFVSVFLQTIYLQNPRMIGRAVMALRNSFVFSQGIFGIGGVGAEAFFSNSVLGLLVASTLFAFGSVVYVKKAGRI